MKRGHPSQPSRSTTSSPGRPLDAISREALKRCAGIVARCGYSPAQAGEFFQKVCAKIPDSTVGKGTGTHDQVDLAAHVLTLWRQEPGYVLPNGAPRPLLWCDRRYSIEALVQRVGRGLTLAATRTYLLSTRSLRKVGTRYVPRALEVAHPSNSRSQQAHHMRVFVDMERTLEHNTRVRHHEQRWFQYSADNPSIPVRLLPVLDRYLRRAGRAALNDLDVFLYRLANSAREGEPTVSVAVGLYRSHGVAARPRRSRRRALNPISQRTSRRP